MGGRYSREVLINRVDLKTKSKIRDYLKSLNLEFEESKEGANTDTVITIDISPILQQKQVLNDLVVFLENERVKIDKRWSREIRLGGGSSSGTVVPASVDLNRTGFSSAPSEYSCFLEEGSECYSTSETSLESGMKISSCGFGRSMSDEEGTSAKTESSVEKPKPLLEMKTNSRPPSLPTPSQPHYRTDSDDDEESDGEVCAGHPPAGPKEGSFFARLESGKKKSAGKFLKMWKGFGKKAGEPEETVSRSLSPEEEKRLMKDLVGSVPQGEVRRDYVVYHLRGGATPQNSSAPLPQEQRESVEEKLRAEPSNIDLTGGIYNENSEQTVDAAAPSAAPSPRPPQRKPDCQFQGVIRFEREPPPPTKCRASKFFNKICRSVSSAPPLPYDYKAKSWRPPASEKVPAPPERPRDPAAAVPTGEQEELRVELIRQQKELSELKALIQYCVEKLSELTDK